MFGRQANVVILFQRFKDKVHVFIRETDEGTFTEGSVESGIVFILLFNHVEAAARNENQAYGISGVCQAAEKFEVGVCLKNFFRRVEFVQAQEHVHAQLFYFLE